MKSNPTRPWKRREKERCGMGIREASEEVQSHTSQRAKREREMRNGY